MDFAGARLQRPQGVRGLRCKRTPDAEPNGVLRVPEPTPRHQEMDHRRGSALLILVGVAVALER